MTNSEAEKKRDDILRRALNTPPKPKIAPRTKKKPAKKAG
jgi:hypothetical protein